MSLSRYFDTVIAPANSELERLLYDRMTEQFLCPSYFDDDNILQNCECKRCE